jgi:hypothetical protein
MRRPRTLVLVAIAAFAFIAISALLARWLAAEGRERDTVIALIKAQAAGDAEAMLDELDPSCRRDRACATQVRANARKLRLAGNVKLLNLASDTAYAFGSATGTTRVVWTVLDEGLPTVQCLTVRRRGSVLAGRSITVLDISAPIGRESSCPAR